MNNYTAIIIDFLKRHGPSQPVQLRQALNKDTFMASAILSDIVKTSSIKSTMARIGSSPLYYLPEQEETAKSKIFEHLEFLEKKLVNRIKEQLYMMDSTLSVQDRFIIKGCMDFIVPSKISLGGREEIVWRYYSVPEERIKERFFEKREIVQEEKRIVAETPEKVIVPEEKPAVKEVTIKEVMPEDAFATAEKMLKGMNAEIVNKSQKNKSELAMTIKFSNGAIQQNYFVKIHLKKKINESDLSLAYTEGTEKKMPVIFMTNGDMTKATEKSLNKKFGDLMKIVKLNNA